MESGAYQTRGYVTRFWAQGLAIAGNLEAEGRRETSGRRVCVDLRYCATDALMIGVAFGEEEGSRVEHR